jgi:hypothetical protein
MDAKFTRLEKDGKSLWTTKAADALFEEEEWSKKWPR